MKGKTIIFVGQKGAGRRTLIDLLTHPTNGIRSLVKIPSFTTRRMRVGESEGNPFFFISEGKYESEIKQGLLFAEGILKHGHRVAAPYYRYVEEMQTGWFPIINLDLDGAKKFKEKFPDQVKVIHVKVTDPRTLFGRVRATEETVGNQYITLEEDDQAMEAFADFTVENPDGELYLDMARAEIWNYILDVVNEHSKVGFIE
ncbi:hypothetical protein [Paenibacillus taichungensis]|uniref:hypothetical protein n=1 Tax=Paenibacillus taichungensis TaxID=484184 RepID=UPI0035DBA77D